MISHSQIWEAMTAKRMPYCQRQSCSQVNVLIGDV